MSPELSKDAIEMLNELKVSRLIAKEGHPDTYACSGGFKPFKEYITAAEELVKHGLLERVGDEIFFYTNNSIDTEKSCSE